MSEKMFTFNPADYAEQFARDGYVHIRQGVTEEFYAKMSRQVDESISNKKLAQFAIGDKQQAMYELPEGGDYVSEIRNTVGGVCRLDPKKVVLSERHVKAYDADAAAEPNAHKDRFASEISFGLSVHVKEGSTLVLYPSDELDINPFNASQLLRSSLSPDQYPEPKLKTCRRVEIKDSARDVILFRGHSIWHLRQNPALTTMLYIKCNTFNCDPLGEDPDTGSITQFTKSAAALSDQQLEAMYPQIGRRVDYVHKHYNRDWREVLGVVLFGEKHFTIDELEMRALRAMDGKRSVNDLAKVLEVTDKTALLSGLRRLAVRGVIDLFPVAS